MVSGIILRTFMIFIYISDENKIRDKKTIANQWTWVSLVNKDQRVKNSLFPSNNGYRFRSCNFVKVYTFIYDTFIA